MKFFGPLLKKTLFFGGVKIQFLPITQKVRVIAKNIIELTPHYLG